MAVLVGPLGLALRTTSWVNSHFPWGAPDRPDPGARRAPNGAVLRATLRAYFVAQRNVSSTASALGVSRKTVNSRLRTVEQGLGRTLDSCALELELGVTLTSRGAGSR